MLCALVNFQVFCQDNGDKKDAKLGVIAGYNLSDVKLNGSDGDAGDADGFYAGVLWEEQLIPLLRIQSGLKYIKNGWSYDNTGANGKERAVLNYLMVPVAARLKIGPLYAIGGVYGAYRAGSKYKYKNGDEEKISTDEIKRWDFGANLGLGFQVAMIGIEARYNWGFTDMTPTAGDYYNRFLEIGLHLHLK